MMYSTVAFIHLALAVHFLIAEKMSTSKQLQQSKDIVVKSYRYKCATKVFVEPSIKLALVNLLIWVVGS